MQSVRSERPDRWPERWVPVRHLRLELDEGALLRLLLRTGWLQDVAPLLAGRPSGGVGGDGQRLVRLRWQPDLLLVHLADVPLVRELAERSVPRPRSA
ncbi:MAG TPA: hypothetical protein VFS29_11525 [Motilibacteraceae bacterium]|nr:hypothetical protein [Motilibacteraceae bacterium]